MCGQSGMFVGSNTIKSEIDIARKLMILNTFRGEHACGMFDYVPGHKDETLFWKSTDHPFDFILEEFDQLPDTRWKDKKPRIIATHCRHATKGKLSEQNAHPFSVGHILGMHNGTIEKAFEGSNSKETDSEAFYTLLNAKGLDYALEAIKNKGAAFAFIWMDLDNHTMNFIRNTKRTLAYGTPYVSTVGPGTMYWSSDPVHLEIAMRANSFSNLKPNVTAFEPYVHYSFDYTKTTVEFTKVDKSEFKDTSNNVYYHSSSYYGEGDPWLDDLRPNPTTHTKPPKETAVVSPKTPITAEETLDIIKNYVAGASANYTSTTTAYDPISQRYFSNPTLARITFLRSHYDSFSKSGVKESAHSSEPAKESGGNTDKPKGQVPFGPGFKALCSPSRFKELLSKGCCYCGDPTEATDRIVWLDRENVVCFNCAADIASNPNHWLFNGGGATSGQRDQITADYTFVKSTN